MPNAEDVRRITGCWGVEPAQGLNRNRRTYPPGLGISEPHESPSLQRDTRPNVQYLVDWLQRMPLSLQNEFSQILAGLHSGSYGHQHRDVRAHFLRFLEEIAEQGYPSMASETRHDIRLPLRELYNDDILENYARDWNVPFAQLRPLFETLLMEAVGGVDWNQKLQDDNSDSFHISFIAPTRSSSSGYSFAIVVRREWIEQHLLRRPPRRGLPVGPARRAIRRGMDRVARIMENARESMGEFGERLRESRREIRDAFQPRVVPCLSYVERKDGRIVREAVDQARMRDTRELDRILEEANRVTEIPVDDLRPSEAVISETLTYPSPQLARDFFRANGVVIPNSDASEDENLNIQNMPGYTAGLRFSPAERRRFMINLEQEGFKVKCKLGDRNESDDSQRELEFKLTRGWGTNAQSGSFTTSTGFPITKDNLLKLAAELKNLAQNF